MSRYNQDHLTALLTRQSNEKARHGSNPNMQAYLASIEREIKSEIEFLEKRGVIVELYTNDDNQMTADELLAELMA